MLIMFNDSWEYLIYYFTHNKYIHLSKSIHVHVPNTRSNKFYTDAIKIQPYFQSGEENPHFIDT